MNSISPSPAQLKIKASTLLFMTTFFWGLTFVYVKEGSAEIGVFSFISFRFIIASLIMFIFFIKRFRHIPKKTLITGFLMGLLLAASYLTQTFGLMITKVTNAAFITGLFVVLVPFFSQFIADIKPRIHHYIAAGISLLGLAIMTNTGFDHISLGDLLVFICAISFALYVVLVGKYTPYHNSIQITTIQLFTVGIVSGLGIFFQEEFIFPITKMVWWDILFCAIFATAISYYIENHYQKYVSDTQAAIIYSFEPIFAALAAWWYLRESITINIIIGAMMILIAMYISAIAKTSKNSNQLSV